MPPQIRTEAVREAGVSRAATVPFESISWPRPPKQNLAAANAASASTITMTTSAYAIGFVLRSLTASKILNATTRW